MEKEKRFCREEKTDLAALGEELDVGASTVETLLELDLVREDERLALGVKHFVERRRDGVVSGLRRKDESEVVLQSRVDGRLLDLPLADIREDL